jgi:hypothetical protein
MFEVPGQNKRLSDRIGFGKERGHPSFYPDNRFLGSHRSSKWTVKAQAIRAALASRENAHRPAKAARGEFRHRAGRNPGPWIVLVGLGQTKESCGMPRECAWWPGCPTAFNAWGRQRETFIDLAGATAVGLFLAMPSRPIYRVVTTRIMPLREREWPSSVRRDRRRPSAGAR